MLPPVVCLTPNVGPASRHIFIGRERTHNVFNAASKVLTPTHTSPRRADRNGGRLSQKRLHDDNDIGAAKGAYRVQQRTAAIARCVSARVEHRLHRLCEADLARDAAVLFRARGRRRRRWRRRLGLLSRWFAGLPLRSALRKVQEAPHAVGWVPKGERPTAVVLLSV